MLEKNSNTTGSVGEHVTVVEKIGTGSFSSVFKAVHLFSQQYVAIKVIDKEDQNYVDVRSVVENEIMVLKQLPMSNNLIDFYEVVF